MILDIIELPLSIPYNDVIELSCPVWINNNDFPTLVSRDMYVVLSDIYRYRIIEGYSNKIIERTVFTTDELDLNSLKLVGSDMSIDMFCISTKIYQMDRDGINNVTGYNHLSGLKELIHSWCWIKKHSINSIHQYIANNLYERLFGLSSNLDKSIINFVDSNTNKLLHLVEPNENKIFDLLSNMENRIDHLSTLSSVLSKNECKSFINKIVGIPAITMLDPHIDMMSSESQFSTSKLIPFIGPMYKQHRFQSFIYSDPLFNHGDDVIYSLPEFSRSAAIELSNTLFQSPFTDISLKCTNGNIKLVYALSIYGKVNNVVKISHINTLVNDVLSALTNIPINEWELVKKYSEEIYLLASVGPNKIKIYFDTTIAILGSVGIVDKNL